MTKKSNSRLGREGHIPLKRDLTEAERLELFSMQQLVTARRYEATLVKDNTALIPGGQRIAQEMEAIVTLLDSATRQWVSAKLVECGYEAGTKCQINISTGMILLEA